MANAANEDLDLDVRVVLLEVEAQLPAILELEALSENLGNGGREDLPDFFKAAAKVVGERPDADAMKILVDTVLGPPPHPAEFPLSVVGPKAARVAGAAFRAAAGPPGQPAPRTVGASEIERRLAGIGDSWAPSPPDPVGEPRWRLRTAAVLRGFFNAGELADQARAAGGEITGDDRSCSSSMTARPSAAPAGGAGSSRPPPGPEPVRHPRRRPASPAPDDARCPGRPGRPRPHDGGAVPAPGGSRGTGPKSRPAGWEPAGGRLAVRDRSRPARRRPAAVAAAALDAARAASLAAGQAVRGPERPATPG